MTDWLGIEVFTGIGIACALGVIIVTILEKITLPNNKITEVSEK